MNNPFFSISIPTYGYNGKGSEFLNFSLYKLSSQTFKNFEVVISDHSTDNTIKDICTICPDKWFNRGGPQDFNDIYLDEWVRI